MPRASLGGLAFILSFMIIFSIWILKSIQSLDYKLYEDCEGILSNQRSVAQLCYLVKEVHMLDHLNVSILYDYRAMDWCSEGQNKHSLALNCLDKVHLVVYLCVQCTASTLSNSKA